MRAFKKQPTLYGSNYVQDLCDKYIKKGGEVIIIEEGVLGWGTTLCRGSGLKTAIIQERFISAWSSGHTIRMYNKCPKKYLNID